MYRKTLNSVKRKHLILFSIFLLNSLVALTVFAYLKNRFFLDTVSAAEFESMNFPQNIIEETAAMYLTWFFLVMLAILFIGIVIQLISFKSHQAGFQEGFKKGLSHSSSSKVN